jgi:hypothetical protein
MMKSTYERGFLIILAIFCLFVFPKESTSGAFKNTYYQFDRWASNFDPMGRALKPLNDLPRFKVGGLLYQWTFFNIDPDKKVGYTQKDWRAQQIEFIGQIQTRYQFAPKTALVNIFHGQYDGIYDWQKSGLYADEVSANAEKTNSWDQFIREFHLDIEQGNWFMKFGRQQAAWGKMEGQWMDFINPMDRKDSLQIRSFFYNELRIPLWMANVTYTFSRSSLQLLWIPDFEPDLSPYPGSVWWSPLRSDSRLHPFYRGEADEPDASFKNHQWALRYDTKISRATWSFGYKYGFSPTSTSFIRKDQGGQLYFDPQYVRQHNIGTALDFAYIFQNMPMVQKMPLVFRAEVIYKTGQFLLDADKYDAANRVLKSGNGYSDTDLVSGAVQLKFFLPGKLSLMYQPMVNYTVGWKDRLNVNEWSLIHLFFISKFFAKTEDRLNFTIYSFLNTGGPANEWQGVRTQSVLSWKFSDCIEGKLHHVDYRGSRKDAYGQYELWDNVGWEILYNF